MALGFLQMWQAMADVISYNGVISSCEKASEWMLALDLLGEMSAVRIAQSVITYSAAVSTCEKGSQWQLALHLLNSLPSAQLTPDAMTFNAAIGACERAVRRCAEGRGLRRRHRAWAVAVQARAQ